MGKTIVFLSQTKMSPPLAEQRARCVGAGDEVVLAGDVRFSDLVKATVRNRHVLRRGDRLKLYDLNSLILATGSLVKLLTRLLGNGVTVEICSEDLVITPDAGDAVFRALALLDGQQRAVHAVRTHAPDVKLGRKAVLQDDQWPEIQLLLVDRKLSPAVVAAQYGVGRTTLFNFIRRMKAADTSAEETVD